MRLLIADVDELMLRLQDRFFSAHGFEVETAVSGVECIEKMRRSPPHAAIIDAHLPWGGGDGVLAAMQGDQSLAGIPIVLLDGADLGLEAMVLKTVIHHRKPVGLATLLQSVRQAAQLPRLRRPPSEFCGPKQLPGLASAESLPAEQLVSAASAPLLILRASHGPRRQCITALR